MDEWVEYPKMTGDTKTDLLALAAFSADVADKDRETAWMENVARDLRGIAERIA